MYYNWQLINDSITDSDKVALTRFITNLTNDSHKEKRLKSLRWSGVNF